MQILATILPLVLAFVILAVLVQLLVRIFADAVVEGTVKQKFNDEPAADRKQSQEVRLVSEVQSNNLLLSGATSLTPVDGLKSEGTTDPVC